MSGRVLSDAQVTAIRTNGLTDSHWTRELRVSLKTVRSARIGRTYGHVPTLPDIDPRDGTGRKAVLNPKSKPARIRRDYLVGST